MIVSLFIGAYSLVYSFYSSFIVISQVVQKGLTKVIQKEVFLFNIASIQVLQLILTSLYRPFYKPGQPILPLYQTRILELSISVYILFITGLFCQYKASITQCYALSFFRVAITFLTAIIYQVIVGKGVLYSVIQGQVLQTRSIRTRLSGPAVLLIALKAIYKAISSLRSLILVIIMLYTL